MPADTIGEWTPNQLLRFVQQQIDDSSAASSPNRTFDEVEITRQLRIVDEIQLDQNQTTVGAAGSASALPATPTGYFKVLDVGGIVRVVPYYAAS